MVHVGLERRHYNLHFILLFHQNQPLVKKDKPFDVAMESYERWMLRINSYTATITTET